MRLNTLGILTLGMICLANLSLAKADDGGETPLEREKRLSAEYIEKMKAEPGATVVDHGVIIRPIYRASSERRASLSDDVTVLYEGFNREGKDFDNAFAREQTEVFPLGRLIQCWQVALPLIPLGSFYKVTCPSDTAYGDKGADEDIAPGAAITFRIQLLDAQPSAPRPSTP